MSVEVVKAGASINFQRCTRLTLKDFQNGVGNRIRCGLSRRCLGRSWLTPMIRRLICPFLGGH